MNLKSNNNTQQDKRGRTNTERPFFLRIVRKGKRNNNHNTSNTKDQEQKPSREAGQEQDERRKREDKRRKEENERTKGKILQDYLTKEKAKHAISR